MKSQYDIERMKYSDLDGFVLLPSYQRKLVWSKTQKENFIDNISNGFPFGSILLYRYEGDKKLSLIDGLQRFSTLREYKENPAQYFSKYDPYVDRIISIIEEGIQMPLSADQKAELEAQIKDILVNYLSEDSDDIFYLRNRISREISIFPTNVMSAMDAITQLQVDLRRAADEFLDLDDLMIPCIVFTGSEDQLPDVFANLNQGGTKLSKYQVLAANWSRYCFVLENDPENFGSAILKRVVDRYEDLRERRGLEIVDFDPQEMEAVRKINLSEYCFALGELIAQECPVFWSSAIDFEKNEDTFNVIGYMSVAIALGVDNRTINKLSKKMILFEHPGFATSLAKLILKEYRTIQGVFELWLKVPGDSFDYESGAIADMQALSFFAALWHKHYYLDEVKKTIEVIDNYRGKGYEQTRKNLVAHCVSDVVGRAWQGAGDSRLASYYVKPKDGAVSNYVEPLSKEVLITKLNTWYSDVASKASINVEKVSKFLLCIYAAPNRTKYPPASYDVEHVVSRQKLKKDSIYLTANIPGGTLGNLMYLKEKTNRGKGGRNLYAIEDHVGAHFDKEYLESNDYPSRAEIDVAEEDLQNGAPEKALRLIKERADSMMEKIASSLAS